MKCDKFTTVTATTTMTWSEKHYTWSFGSSEKKSGDISAIPKANSDVKLLLSRHTDP